MKEELKVDWSNSNYDTYAPYGANISIGRKSHEFNTYYITCGVLAITDLPSNKKIKNWKETITKDELVEYFKEAFNQLCHLGKKSRKAHLVFTDTEKGGKEFGEILDEICSTKTDYTVNVNTGNNIKVWVFTKT